MPRSYAATEKTVIVIDAGHGGEDGGSTVAGVSEKDINLDIALRLELLFRLFGFETAMTRKTDTALHGDGSFNKRADMDARVRIVMSFNKCVLISIHANEFTNSRYFGAQMFCSDCADARLLAEKTMTSLKTLQPENKRSVKLIPSSLYLYRNVSCPVLLAECGFLSNPGEREKLCDGEYRMKLAMAIFSGYAAYLESEVTINAGNKNQNTVRLQRMRGPFYEMVRQMRQLRKLEQS